MKLITDMHPETQHLLPYRKLSEECNIFLKSKIVIMILYIFIIFHYIFTEYPVFLHYFRAQNFDSVHCPRLAVMPITSESSESDTSIQINALALKYLKHGEPGE
jgi:hypothetical protein